MQLITCSTKLLCTFFRSVCLLVESEMIMYQNLLQCVARFRLPFLVFFGCFSHEFLNSFLVYYYYRFYVSTIMLRRNFANKITSALKTTAQCIQWENQIIWNNTHRRSNYNCSEHMKMLTSNHMPDMLCAMLIKAFFVSFRLRCWCCFIFGVRAHFISFSLFLSFGRSYYSFVCVHTHGPFHCRNDIDIEVCC